MRIKVLNELAFVQVSGALKGKLVLGLGTFDISGNLFLSEQKIVCVFSALELFSLES